MLSPFKISLLGASIVVDIVILDQITKYLFVKSPDYVLDIIPGFFRFIYAENTGIAFSIPLEGLPLQIITILMIGYLIYAVKKFKIYEHLLPMIFVAMILGGAIGNAIDRIFRGFVVDFISVGTFPIFNVADSFVSIGVFGLVLYYLILERKKKNS